MNLRTRLTAESLALFLVAGFFSLAYGGYSECQPVAVAEIEPLDGGKSARILVEFVLPEHLVGAEVDYAEMIVPLGIEARDNTCVGITATRLATEWNSDTVSWTDPWDSPGGDLGGRHARVSVVKARGVGEAGRDVTIDLTDIVQNWANDPSGNHGLAISPIGSAARISASRPEVLRSDIKLRVYFTSARYR
jgi:hypothetical protein